MVNYTDFRCTKQRKITNSDWSDSLKQSLLLSLTTVANRLISIDIKKKTLK